jgi:hypothetical protein
MAVLAVVTMHDISPTSTKITATLMLSDVILILLILAFASMITPENALRSPPGNGFLRWLVHAAHKEAAGHHDSGAGPQKKGGRVGGPAIALARGLSPGWVRGA